MTSARPHSTLKILISRNSTGTIGGAELSAADQAEVLAARGHQVYFISALKPLRRQLPAGVKTYGWLRAELGQGWWRQLRLLVLTPWTFIQAAIYGLWLKPDLINPHSREDQVAFTLTKFLHRRPVVWKHPGDLRYKFLTSRANPLAQLNQKLLAAAIARADHIYSLNEADNRFLLDHVKGLKSERLSVIPSGILFDRYNRQAKGPETNALIIGTVIRLHWTKNVDDLVKAFLSLPANSFLELWLIGDGPERPKLEKLAGDDRRVKFFGERAEVSGFLSAIDIFVQPSHSEPWGRNIAEAMYFGKAIVGAKAGGVAQQLTDGQTGLLYQPGDIRQLTEKLQKLIDDVGLRHKLGQAAKSAAIQRGDFRTIVTKQILPLYQKILNKNQP